MVSIEKHTRKNFNPDDVDLVAILTNYKILKKQLIQTECVI